MGLLLMYNSGTELCCLYMPALGQDYMYINSQNTSTDDNFITSTCYTFQLLNSIQAYIGTIFIHKHTAEEITAVCTSMNSTVLPTVANHHALALIGTNRLFYKARNIFHVRKFRKCSNKREVAGNKSTPKQCFSILYF